MFDCPEFPKVKNIYDAILAYLEGLWFYHEGIYRKSREYLPEFRKLSLKWLEQNFERIRIYRGYAWYFGDYLMDKPEMWDAILEENYGLIAEAIAAHSQLARYLVEGKDEFVLDTEKTTSAVDEWPFLSCSYDFRGAGIFADHDRYQKIESCRKGRIKQPGLYILIGDEEDYDPTWIGIGIVVELEVTPEDVEFVPQIVYNQIRKLNLKPHHDHVWWPMPNFQEITLKRKPYKARVKAVTISDIAHETGVFNQIARKVSQYGVFEIPRVADHYEVHPLRGKPWKLR